jgi:hypothetical protein
MPLSRYAVMQLSHFSFIILLSAAVTPSFINFAI